jgi:hypothetical protein
MKKIYDAVVTVGEYEDRQTGKTKKQYRTVGAVLQNDDGRLSLKLELIPAVNFNGWINFYEPREKEQKPQGQRAAPTDDGGFGDEIPF